MFRVDGPLHIGPPVLFEAVISYLRAGDFQRMGPLSRPGGLDVDLRWLPRFENPTKSRGMNPCEVPS